jgi:hypothetical protein
MPDRDTWRIDAETNCEGSAGQLMTVRAHESSLRPISADYVTVGIPAYHSQSVLGTRSDRQLSIIGYFAQSAKADGEIRCDASKAL